MKKALILLTTVLLLGLVFLCSCVPTQKTLNTPQGLIVNNGKLYWQSVDGANSYIVMINGIEQPQTSTTQFDLSTANLQDGQAYTLQVKAVGDGINILSSAYSTAITYTHSTSTNNNNNNGNNNENTAEAIVNVNNGKTENNVKVGIEEFYITHPNTNVSSVIESCTDGKYNYYLFYLGYIENYPLLIGEGYNHQTDGPGMSDEQTITKLTAENFMTSVETNTNVSASISSKLTVSAGGNYAGFHANLKTETEWAVGITNGRKDTETLSNTYQEEKTSKSVYTFNENTKSGWYRYVKYTAACDFYVLVTYDIEANKDKEKKEFEYTYITFSDEDNIYTLFDYAPVNYEDLASNKERKLEFDEKVLENIDVNKELEFKDLTIEDQPYPIDIPVNKHLCGHDTGYDKKTDGNDKSPDQASTNVEVGHLIINGCVEDKNGKFYTIKNENEFEIQYFFDEDPYNLPNEIKELRVFEDTEKNVIGIALKDGERVGMGAYKIEFISKTGKTISEQIVKSNFMSGCTKDSYYSLLTAKDLPEELDISQIGEIKITIVYEIYAWYGMHYNSIDAMIDGTVKKDDYTDWRCEYTFKFN